MLGRTTSRSHQEADPDRRERLCVLESCAETAGESSPHRRRKGQDHGALGGVLIWVEVTAASVYL